MDEIGIWADVDFAALRVIDFPLIVGEVRLMFLEIEYPVLGMPRQLVNRSKRRTCLVQSLTRPLFAYDPLMTAGLYVSGD